MYLKKNLVPYKRYFKNSLNSQKSLKYHPFLKLGNKMHFHLYVLLRSPIHKGEATFIPPCLIQPFCKI